jgi:hypothetical protein
MAATKRRFIFGLIAKTLMLLVVPQIAYLILLANFVFMPKGFWEWFSLIAAECAAWVLFLAGIAQLVGASLPQWLGWDVLRILGSFEAITNRTLDDVRDTLPILNRRIKRDEIIEVQEYLANGQPVLITGESGTGKSGIAASIIREALHSGVPTLFLNARNYTAIVSNFGDLQSYIGVNLPIRDCLNKIITRFGRCLVVVDQLDSSIGQAAFQASTELLAAAKNLSKIEVVAVSSTFDTERDQTIRNLEFKKVESNRLDRDKVISIFGELKITTPSESLLALSQNLFYLSVVTELAAETDVNLVGGRATLLEKYLSTLQRIEGPEFVQAAIDLAYENLDAGKRDFMLPRVQDKVVGRLLSRGILIAVANGLFRFRHEQLLYYFYAVGAIDKSIEPSSILEHIAGHYAGSALVWILRLYRQRNLAELLEEYLREALLQSDKLGFYERVALLDEILSWLSIDAIPAATAVIVDMLGMDSKKSLRTYFFQKRPIAEWAPILWGNGFFDSPPPAEKTEQGYFLTQWDVQWYLISVAPQVPEIVVKHVLTISGDSWYISRALHALGQIPSPFIESVIPRIADWLHDRQTRDGIADETCDLMEKLISDGRIESGLILFRALTAPVFNVSSERIASKTYWELEPDRTLESVFGTKQQPGTGYESLKKLLPQAVVEICESHLLASLKIEAEVKGNPEYEISSWWRHAIEDTDQDILDTYDDRMVCALRDAVETLVQGDTNVGKQLLSRYLDDQHSILRRVGLYILCAYPSHFVGFVSRELLKQENIDDSAIHHEYFMLLKSGFPHLSSAEQTTIVNLILNGPDEKQTQDLIEWANQNLGADREKYALEYRNSWIRDRLWMIKDCLNADIEDLLKKLVAEGGEPNHPAYLSWHTGFYAIHDSSPISNSELARLSPNGLLRFLEGWHPDPRQRFEPERISHAGLAIEVANVVLANPERYWSVIGEIVTIHPQYAAAIIGHWENSEASRPIPWDMLIKLSKHLLAESAVWSNEVNITDHSSWWSVRLSIARVLEIGLRDKDRLIPNELLLSAKEILVLLADDPNPSPDFEQPQDETPNARDPYTNSLNCVRPVAVRTLIWYAVRQAHVVEPTGNDTKNTLNTHRLEPNVKEILIRKVDKRLESSRAVHAVFGELLPTLDWLDREWVKTNIDLIFPTESNEESIWFFVAAWDAFVTCNSYYPEFLEWLGPFYKQAIDYASMGYISKTYLHPVQHLAIHVAFEYLLAEYDLISSIGNNSLIAQFFTKLDLSGRKDMAWALWLICKDNPDESENFWPRARSAWEWRTREVIAANHSPDFDEEMGKFAQLVLVAPEYETIATMQPLLAGVLPHLVRSEFRNFEWEALEKFLAKQVDRYPVDTIRFYRLMYEQREAPPRWFHHEPEARKIIETAAANLSSQKEALSLINFLAQWGDHEFRDVYDHYAS